MKSAPTAINFYIHPLILLLEPESVFADKKEHVCDEGDQREQVSCLNHLLTFFYKLQNNDIY